MDNDLMARRLRPPSEPPRPQNGHSPLPLETPPWAALPDSGAEVPWDRPAPEQWPPTTEETTANAWDAAPVTHGWPAAPHTTLQPPDVTDATEAADTTEVAQLTDEQPSPTDVTTDAPVQPQPAPWDTETAPIWGGAAPWDPQPMTLQSNTVSDDEQPSAPEAVAPETPALETVAPEPDVTENATDASVPGRPSWDVPVSSAWDELRAIDDRPSDMLDAYDEMIPVVTRRVAEAQAVAAMPQVAAQETLPEPAVEAQASFDGQPAAEPEPESEPTVEPQSPFTWPVLSEPSSAAESTPWAAESARWAEQSQPAAETEPAPWSEAVEPAAEPEAAPPWLTQYEVGTAEPATPSLTQDPYDADAPVLDDVEHASAPLWLDWTPAADVNPVVPGAVGGKILGPTPPDDLFEQPAAPVLERSEPSDAFEASNARETAEPMAGAGFEFEPEFELEPEYRAEPESAPEPDSAPEPTHEPAREPAPTRVATTTQSLVFSTGPGQQPLVLRIELAIVDQSSHIRAADLARRVGPWSDEEPVTPRHPEFEPRTHATAAPGETQQTETVLPWALPPLFEPNPTATWTLEAAPADPLANLPAATFEPPVPSTQPVGAPSAEAPVEAAPAPQATPVDAQASAVQSVAMAPATAVPAVSAPNAPVSAAVATTRPQVNPDQSDLWFLASEPTVEGADGVEPGKTAQTSSTLTAGLTIGMAVVVIFLVLVFIYMMTSLLH